MRILKSYIKQRRKRCVFRRLQNDSNDTDVMCWGRPFQTQAVVTEKARSPMIDSRLWLTVSKTKVTSYYTGTGCLVIGGGLWWNIVVCMLFRKPSVCSNQRTKSLMVSWIPSGQSGCRRCAVLAASVVVAWYWTRDTCLRLEQVLLTRGFSSTLFPKQKYSSRQFVKFSDCCFVL